MSTYGNVDSDQPFTEIVEVNKSGIETVALGQ
jgi:hypothetical protein